MSQNFFVKCPNCGNENQVNSLYWELDMGANISCSFCKIQFYCNHPKSPWKKTKESVAYTKNEE